ncbi:MAG: hypothetical protein ACRD8O_05465, partial [Bryobacteraceae bacterium]
MKNWRQFASILALIAGIERIAGAAPFYLPDVANFYQHQKAFQGQYPAWNPDGTWKAPNADPLPDPPDPAEAAAAYNSPKNWWERGGGWCCTTAVSDLLYSIQKNYYPTGPALFWGELGHTWFEYMNFGIEQFYFDYFAGGKNFATILDDRGFGPTRIRYDEYFVEGGVVMHANAPSGFCGVCPNGAGTFAYNSVKDLYLDALANNRYVALNIVSTGLTAAQQDARGIWWNYHVIAGAGIDVANDLIFIADPNRNNTGSNRGVGPNAGIGWGHPYA